MKRSIVLTIALTLLATSVAAQAVMRPRPGVGAVAIPNTTPQTKTRTLDAGALAARLQPAAAFTPLNQLGRGRTAAGLDPRITIPDLTSAFKLTPGTQKVDGRGELDIQGDTIIPNPKPEGFQGQSTITRTRYSPPRDNEEYGRVIVTITAQKEKFYVVDCLAMIDKTNDGFKHVEYRISGSSTDTSGTIVPLLGHVVFNVRRTESDGNIEIMFRPQRAEARTPGGPWDKHIMDFWGCQISSG